MWSPKKIPDDMIDTFIKMNDISLSDNPEFCYVVKRMKELFSNCDKGEMSVLIDKYLVPTELEQKGNAEVPTPHALRKEMLDKMPDGEWSEYYVINDDDSRDIKLPTIFEPCCGKGGFLVDIVGRLMNGLEDYIPDKAERKKRILQECLYFADLSKMNIFICKILLDPNDEYELNCYSGDTLKLDIRKEWGIEKFNTIIGNPPYEEKGKTGDNKLYLHFTRFCMNILNEKGILLFITPTPIVDYMITMNKNRNCFDQFYDIKYIALNTPAKYFTVNSTFTYFLLVKQDYTTNTQIEHLEGIDTVTLKKGMVLPKRMSKIDLNIIQKITSTTTNYELLTCTFPKTTRRIRNQHVKNGIVSETETETHKYKIYETVNKDNPSGKCYFYDKLDRDCDKKRIMLSKKGYLMPLIPEENTTYSDSFSYILHDDNLLDLLKSKILKYLIYQFSKNGYDRINCVKMLKKVKLTSDIYDSFNLTPDEISIIENTK
jgi:hypothetical protein